MQPDQPLSARSDVIMGDDVLVTFPSGREVAGRVEEPCGDTHWIVWVDDYSDNRLYPRGWVRAWEH